MKRKLSVSATLALLLLAVLTTYLITNTTVTQRFETELDAISQSRTDFQKLAAVDRIVRQNYVTDVDETFTSEGSIAGYLGSLGDPRCRYLDYEDYEDYRAQSERVLGATGITPGYEESENRVLVLRVSAGSSAEAAGVLAGDELLSVNGQSPEDVEFPILEDAMTGPVGESAALVLAREGESYSIEAEYTAAGFGSVSGRMCFTQAAYLVIDDFDQDCSIRLRDEVNALIEQGADVLIFDVRGTQSFNFEEAAKCAGVIAGNVPLARRTVSGTSDTITGDTTPIPLPCAVLIDENTQGAGELFAASLKDTRGAYLVGAKSAGNASVQALIELSDRTALLLTTKLYLPPASDSFDQKGLEPTLSVVPTLYRAAADADDPALTAAYELLKPRYAAKLNLENDI